MRNFALRLPQTPWHHTSNDEKSIDNNNKKQLWQTISKVFLIRSNLQNGNIIVLYRDELHRSVYPLFLLQHKQMEKQEKTYNKQKGKAYFAKILQAFIQRDEA